MQALKILTKADPLTCGCEDDLSLCSSSLNLPFEAVEVSLLHPRRRNLLDVE